MKSLPGKLLFGLLAMVMVPGLALAVVTGSAEWNWAEYRRDQEGRDEVKASHFFQQYSLLYRDRQMINGGRAGRWDIGLGYEWTAVDASIDGDDSSVDTSKILYEGEILFAPGGLPFRINAYSRDLHRSRPNYSLSSPALSGATLISPDIATGIHNGQRIATGVTLLAGIKNGSYLGEYREMLAAFPKLLVDYRDVYVRDKQGFDPEHYHLRDLAFVSLNKKDNWFHYRVSDFKDYEDRSNDYDEKNYLLGTVDHLLRRQWISLTNWIRISTDASLTISTNAPGQSSERTEELYQFNLFTEARRPGWGFSNFTTLSRMVDDLSWEEKELEIPWFAYGQIDPKSRWKMQVRASRRQEGLLEGDLRSRRQIDEDLFYTQFQVETGHLPGRILTPTFEADYKRSVGQAQGQAVRAGFELRNDLRRKAAFDWLAGYSLAWFENANTSESYYEQTLTGSLERSLTARLRIGVSQRLAIGTGSYETGTVEHMRPLAADNFLSRYENRDEMSLTDGGTVVRSISEGFAEWGSGQKNHRVNALFDWLQQDDDLHRLRLDHSFRYSGPVLHVNTSTVFEEGDAISSQINMVSEIANLDFYTGAPDKALSHETRVSYMPNRSWMHKGMAGISWAEGHLGDGWLAGLRQESSYTRYRLGGLRQTLFTLYQTFEYERAWVNDDPWYTGLELRMVYYPSRTLSLSADLAGRHYGLLDQTEFEYELAAIFRYPKFEARVAYSYGQIDSDTAFLPGVKEQRWEVGLRKIF